MGGNIWYFDTYDLRKFKVGEYSTFLDIGANRGTTSFMAKMLNPKARVIAIEPCVNTFEYMKKHVGTWWGKKIEYYNVALGDGNPMSFHQRKRDGQNRFYSGEEKQWWIKDAYSIPSLTIAQIFKQFHIDVSAPYLVKIDCEGGERFVLQQEESIGFLRGAVQIIMELHPSLGGTKAQWDKWLRNISDTHEIRYGRMVDKKTPTARYEFIPCTEIPYEFGQMTIQIIRKEWKDRGY